MAEHQRVALVVGGGTGIGLATAERLARRQYALVLAGRREDVLTEAQGGLSAQRASVAIAAGDAGNESDARAMVEAAVDEFGRLDACVNCAGIYEPVDFVDLDAESWRRTMRSTLDAAAFVSVAASRQMKEQEGGRIVLTSSINDPLSEPESAHYSAAKAGVSSLARSMAVDLSRFGIRTNAVAPSWVHTPMADDFVRNASQESLQRINILGRVGQPDEIANVIEYLVVDAPDYLTGATIFVDGGQTAMAPLP